MNVTDEHVRTVRACLLDIDEFERRSTRLQWSDDLEGYRVMLTGVLFRLIERRFADSGDRAAAAIRWVARLRAQESDLLEQGSPDHDPEAPDPLALDPVAAEQMILGYLGLPTTYAEYDEETRAVTQTTVLLKLYEDLNLTDDELDQLLADARDAVTQAT